MKLRYAILMTLLISGCQAQSTDPAKETPEAERKKTTAEEAFDAGQRARQKAEAIKKEQQDKANKAIDDTNQ